MENDSDQKKKFCNVFATVNFQIECKQTMHLIFSSSITKDKTKQTKLNFNFGSCKKKFSFEEKSITLYTRSLRKIRFITACFLRG